MKKVLVALLAIAMVVTSFVGNNSYIQAATTVDTIKVKENPENIVKPGETAHVKMTMPVLKINDIAVNYLYAGNDTFLEFDVTASDYVKIGTYPINIKFTYTPYSFDGSDPSPVECIITTKIKVKEEKVPVQLTANNINLENSSIGNDTNISMLIKNEGELSAMNIGDLTAGASKNITLPISIFSNAATGRRKITANFTYKTTGGEEKQAKFESYINLTAPTNTTKAPNLSVQNIDTKEGLKLSQTFKLGVDLKNIGGADARNITVTIDDASAGVGSEGIIKDYYTAGITAAPIKASKTGSVDIPLKVSKYATGGLKEIKVVISYTDASGNPFTITEKTYVDVVTPTPTPTPTPTLAPEGSPNLVISNVTQTPASPIAGDKVELTFEVENKSDVDAELVKISTEGLSTTTFIPVESEPYLYYDKIKAGEKIQVTLGFLVSNSITEGLNSITVKCSYKGGESTGVIPVRDVVNDVGGISKPKLIVSKYYTDAEELRAGSTFNFTFDLYNTNATVAAKNITVTISQADNIFTVTQGSNSFFINKIAAGETITNTLELKVKSDATTKAYPIEITIEYEYDGAEPNPTTGEIGESKTEKLNLQAVENSRPVVNNVQVYSYDGMITVGTPATLAFEFYNMGKSPLNNVIAKVEGDFIKSDGEMQIIGNVAEGTPSYVEFQVTPNLEGDAKGVLRFTFEDSNGDQVEFTQDFGTFVSGMTIIDPGPIDPGTGVFNPDEGAAKKEILPLWAFIVAQIVIFLLFIPITRKVIINVYKARLRKQDEKGL
ncbi:MAG: hypothetical protein K0R00_4260 [Herbinix sp.]|nr:hypothetical protein [Herbinix sp.]